MEPEVIENDEIRKDYKKDFVLFLINQESLV